MIIYNGYEPHDKQTPFHKSTAKFRAIITGVGFGKSAAGANEMIKTALQYPKSTHLIIAPTSKLMNFATLEQFWKFCPKEIVKDHAKSKQYILLKNGAKILYLTADNERHVDRLRGIEIGSFWADEARLFPNKIWEILLTRLRDPNGPLKGWVTTTPHGYNWLYYYFVKKQHPRTKKYFDNPEQYEWFSGSTLDNPFTPQEYKDNLLNQLAGKFREQEIYGKFQGFEGQVYDNFVHKTHIMEKIDKEFTEVIAGLDFGFTNKTACLIIGLDSDKRAYILEEYYRERMEIEDVGRWLKSMTTSYPKLTNIYADPSEPMFINKLNQMGLNVLQAKNEVMPGINFVYSMFEVQEDKKPRIFIDLKCGNLLDEINSYRYAEPKDEKDSKEEPLKVNDHLVDGLRYALYTHLEGRGNYFLLTDDEGAIF